MAAPVVTKSIGVQNIFSDWLFVKGYFNWSLWGTWVGTVTLQRTFDGGSTQLDVTTSAANTESIKHEPEGAYYRFGIKTGDYTSGTLQGRIGADPSFVPKKQSMT